MPNNAAYSDEPSRGEFPPPNQRYYNGTITGTTNGIPCPMNLSMGYEISNSDTDYDWARLYDVDWVDNYYMVLNLKNPINQTPYEVYSVDSYAQVTQVDPSEPWNNPRNVYMRQLFDFDLAEYCGQRAPHNPPNTDPPVPPQTDPCQPIQGTLNWFKP